MSAQSSSSSPQEQQQQQQQGLPVAALVPGNVYLCKSTSGADASHYAVFIEVDKENSSVPLFIHVHGTGPTALVARVQKSKYDPSRYSFIDHPWNSRTFCQAGEKPKKDENQRFSNDVVVARAEQALADFKNKKNIFVYDVKYSNTEHFALMCLANEYFSPNHDAKYYSEMTLIQKAGSSLSYIPTNGYSAVQWVKSFVTPTALPMNQRYSESLPVTATTTATTSNSDHNNNNKNTNSAPDSQEEVVNEAHSTATNKDDDNNNGEDVK